MLLASFIILISGVFLVGRNACQLETIVYSSGRLPSPATRANLFCRLTMGKIGAIENPSPNAL